MVRSPLEIEPVVLGTWPTPLERAPRLATRVGLAENDLWIKRDDLSGLGGGGNQVRKLQYSCAEALAQAATVLVTSGAAQSNHCRLTAAAAAAARLGVRCVLVLRGDRPPVSLGNLVLDHLAAASVIWVGTCRPTCFGSGSVTPPTRPGTGARRPISSRSEGRARWRLGGTSTPPPSSRPKFQTWSM